MALAKLEVCELDSVTVTNTNQTFAQMGLTLNIRAKVLSIQNVGVNNIRVAVGRDATANDFVILPVGATSLRLSANLANTLRFVTDASTSPMNVQQMGDE